ncbi:MAG TPA: DUF4124 domain-containing protein [Thiopseudomonas sp.]|nr:DUF4124 domain-containing protein [Thiopseudomonas sp.]
MRLFIIAVNLLLLLSLPASAAPIYKWVDAQGVTHFASEPPANQKAESINTPRFQPTPAPKQATPDTAINNSKSSKIQADIDREVRQQVAEETAALKKYCTQVRYNLAQLKNNPRILTEIAGETVPLSEEERQARISKLKKALAERCAAIE